MESLPAPATAPTSQVAGLDDVPRDGAYSAPGGDPGPLPVPAGPADPAPPAGPVWTRPGGDPGPWRRAGE